MHILSTRTSIDMHILSTRTTISPFSLVRFYVPGNMSLNYSSFICNLRHQPIFARLILVRYVCIRDTASNVLRGIAVRVLLLASVVYTSRT